MAMLATPSVYRPDAATSDAVEENSADALETLAIVTHASLGETLYYQNDPADHWYRVIGGAACECVLMTDGRRQIVDFLLPGDLFGFCSREQHDFSVEVIVDGTSFARYPRQRVEALAASDPDIARSLREKAFESISRLQVRTVLLGRTNALEKVSAFLLEMADRFCAGAEDELLLPMSRYDIADYLAMAVETVSRALTTLRTRGAIALSGTRVVRILDRNALQENGGVTAMTRSQRYAAMSPNRLHRIDPMNTSAQPH